MIDRCPQCRYHLVGLPDEHTCPECGFEYDRRAVLIEPPQMGQVVFGVASSVMALVGISLWMWQGRGLGQSLYVTVGLMGVATTIWRLRRPGRKILASPREIRVFRPGGKEQVVLLADVGGADWSASLSLGRWQINTGGVVLRHRDGSTLVSLEWEFFRSKHRAETLISAIRRYQAP